MVPGETRGTAESDARDDSTPLRRAGITRTCGWPSKSQIVLSEQLSQRAAARRLNVNQPKASALSNYQLDSFSVERLIKFLNVLDRDVQIVTRRKPRSRKSGKILVRAA
jgi:helix-turn-helix protein